MALADDRWQRRALLQTNFSVFTLKKSFFVSIVTVSSEVSSRQLVDFYKFQVCNLK